MAAALARGWAGASRAGLDALHRLGSGRAQALADEVGGQRLGRLRARRRADLVVLAVKPAGLDDVAAEIAGRPGGVISVLGATPLETLARRCPDPGPAHDAQPRRRGRRGVICHADGPVRAPLGALGRRWGARRVTVIEVEESELDAATAVMGCAPAYIALAVEELIEAGVEAGLDAELSRGWSARQRQGWAGTCCARARRDETAIASPGGSTEAGLDARRSARSTRPSMPRSSPRSSG